MVSKLSHIGYNFTQAEFSKNFVLEGIKISLVNNNCFFNNKYYNQIKGTAMGKIFAPTYATLTMGTSKFYQICKLKWGKHTRLHL